MTHRYSNMREHTPYLPTYDMIMDGGTREYDEHRCYKCGWKVDQEDSIETSNQYMGIEANVKRYHNFCHSVGKSMMDEMHEAMEESMND